MAQKIAIFGAGGFAREVLQVIHDINESNQSCKPWIPVGFVVDQEYVSEKLIQGLPILGSIEWLLKNPEVAVVIAIGSSSVRKNVADQLKNKTNNPFATLIHPGAWVGRQVNVAEGSIICAGALITTDVSIGRHVHVNIGCTIGHDALLHDFVTLNPSVCLSGHVEIGSGVEMGTGSIVIPHLVIGEWSIIGAGTVVTKVIPSKVTAVGVPARVVKIR